VLEATDGEKALLLCKEYAAPIHLMLTDVVMPEMNGRELVYRFSETYLLKQTTHRTFSSDGQSVPC